MEFNGAFILTRSEVMSQSSENEFSRSERDAHDGDLSQFTLPLSESQKRRPLVMNPDRSACRTRQSQRHLLIQIHVTSSAEITRDPVRFLIRVAENGMSGRVVDWD